MHDQERWLKIVNLLFYILKMYVGKMIQDGLHWSSPSLCCRMDDFELVTSVVYILKMSKKNDFQSITSLVYTF